MKFIKLSEKSKKNNLKKIKKNYKKSLKMAFFLRFMVSFFLIKKSETLIFYGLVSYENIIVLWFKMVQNGKKWFKNGSKYYIYTITIRNFLNIFLI